MTPVELEHMARKRRLSVAEFTAACEQMETSLEKILDTISLSIARRYLAGQIDFEYADAVMNGLFEVITLGHPTKFASDTAWSIYLAFDDGEWRHSGDSERIDPVEKYTRPQLVMIVNALEANRT